MLLPVTLNSHKVFVNMYYSFDNGLQLNLNKTRLEGICWGVVQDSAIHMLKVESSFPIDVPQSLYTVPKLFCLNLCHFQCVLVAKNLVHERVQTSRFGHMLSYRPSYKYSLHRQGEFRKQFCKFLITIQIPHNLNHIQRFFLEAYSYIYTDRTQSRLTLRKRETKRLLFCRPLSKRDAKYGKFTVIP
jgi:hypothetical protein